MLSFFKFKYQAAKLLFMHACGCVHIVKWLKSVIGHLFFVHMVLISFFFSSFFFFFVSPSNCKIQEHTISSQTRPSDIPNYGSLVLFTNQALNVHPTSQFWSEVASEKPHYLLWAFHSMLNPYGNDVDFMSFRNYGFNLTLTYKPDSDIFTPYNFWVGQAKPNPRVLLLLLQLLLLYVFTRGV